MFFIPKPRLWTDKNDIHVFFLRELQPLKVNKASSGTASLAAMKPVQDRAKIEQTLVKAYVLVLATM